MAEYVIKVVLCQVILYLFYHFFLAKEKSHGFNRYYLVFALLFSVIIPMLKVPSYFPTAIDFSSVIFTDESPNSYDASNINLISEVGSFSVGSWLTIFYIITLLIFTFRMIRNLFRINLVALSYEKLQYSDHELILTNNKILPYSFLKKIFVNKDDFQKGKISDELFIHEIYHIQQKHSYDIILVEVIQALFWFNPILMLHNRAIRLNHEYLADHAVIDNKAEINDYQKILLEAVSNKKLPPITSGFSAAWTKKRLLMMSKPKSVLSTTFKILLAIPTILLLTFSFVFSPETRSVTSEKELNMIFMNYPNFYGTWEGIGRFNNISLSEEVGKIPISITIHKDKTATGKVGDAQLSEIEFFTRNYGIGIQAKLSEPVRQNSKIDKELIIILWVLPEIEKNKVDANFHLTNNFFFDPYINVGGGILTKMDNYPEELNID